MEPIGFKQGCKFRRKESSVKEDMEPVQAEMQIPAGRKEKEYEI